MAAARQAKIGQSEVEINLAKKEYWPDMDFKVAYGQRDDDPTGGDRPDFFSATVTIKFPLWAKSRQNKKLAAAKKSHEAADKILSQPGGVSPLSGGRLGH